MCFRVASEQTFRIASDLGMCDSNRIAHRGCIARFGPLSCKAFQKASHATGLWCVPGFDPIFAFPSNRVKLHKRSREILAKGIGPGMHQPLVQKRSEPFKTMKRGFQNRPICDLNVHFPITHTHRARFYTPPLSHP